jgi:hypothetical protein
MERRCLGVAIACSHCGGARASSLYPASIFNYSECALGCPMGSRSHAIQSNQIIIEAIGVPSSVTEA